MTAFSEALKATRETGARILIIDIERRPMLSYHWAPKVDYIAPQMNVERGAMISFAAKWYGEKQVMFRSTFHDGHDEMLAEAWQLMDEAHILIGYNSRGFDVKHMCEEFIKSHRNPPSPHKDIDLLTAARGRFRFAYNKLDEVCRELGLETKLAHEGWELWERCLNDDPKAWATMRRYNKQDVVITEQLYDRLRPWIKGHPNLNMYRAERVSGCPHCGSVEVEDNGFHYTQTRAYKQFACSTCGAHSRATHSEGDRTQHRRTA